MYQERLIHAIQKRIGQKKSILEAISQALEISYDAAHRRISMKSKFSIEETVKLAQHFGISMDTTFQGADQVLVKKTKEIKSLTDLADYFDQSIKSFSDYKRSADTTLFYSAKDIPLFYLIESNLLSKFKLYVWSNLLNFEKEETKFESFQVQAPLSLKTQKMRDFYQDISRHEIWNDTTINSTLQQILYFFQSGLLAAETARLLCDNLLELISSVEEKCTAKNEQYKLYYHELLILNNNVLISDTEQMSLFVPYTMLGYFITKDLHTCQNVSDFFQHQLKNSKLLNKAGTRDKKMFFNKMYQKIAFFKNQIEAITEF
ncbi:hypothetical protein LZQ00_06205 [Sphingobacterium sp. SRCM116780]|uniref:hypothetical protein n=1 Tax=Sphingobacterium sp. SRCM116780 TaxID=2907623 RepID=UPI001F4510B1|nr:hypothetical protein [Sphingobacterium sp. SRCM116780]UIR57406.1 hypothetical protein LZQ00_06205 [Sphingobacterium sp. SRCM116780]